ncbi:MAG: cysteine--tRNA ligase [Thermostichales cyanobacterium BF4_bins_65]
MTLHLFNTLSRHKEPFLPRDPERVTIYVCGVTVYDFCHLGHARTYVVWDVLRRYLLACGYGVRYVQNFTDVDDKILRRALENHETMEAVAERFIQAYFEDMDRLNILRADAYPRVTQSLPAIHRLIESLSLKQFAYAVQSRINPQSQDVYYAVRQFPDYGKLSGRKLSDLQAGASGRVGEEEANKRDPFDFALWKSAVATEPGFDSPWGYGRPGWHIECSAMVREYLGDSIDIHAGGADLIFPHHENEIAQSEAATGKPLARYWLHNGFLNIHGEKMSKSLGNFTTLRAALETCDPMALRLFFLQTHYRSPIDFTPAAIAAAANGWATLVKAAHSFPLAETAAPDPQILAAFQEAMDDDLNTSAALAILFDLAKELIREKNLLTHQQSPTTTPSQTHLKTLHHLLGILGLLIPPAPATTSPSLSETEIEARIEQRRQAKQARNFALADQIREELKAAGVSLVDQKDGSTRWFRS